MTVSWRPLTLVEARGIITGYAVTYTVSARASRRQTDTVTTGPDMSSVTIEGLDANAAYDVSVQASNSAGNSEPASTPAPPPGEGRCSSVLAFSAVWETYHKTQNLCVHLILVSHLNSCMNLITWIVHYIM